MSDDISRWGEAYTTAYADELETCVAVLDRMLPERPGQPKTGWRNRQPFADRPADEVATIKRYLLRHHQIVTGHGDCAVLLQWRAPDTPQRKPFATTLWPERNEFGEPKFDGQFRQLINPALLAKRMRLPFDAVEAALDARPVTDRDPRGWVRAWIEARKPKAAATAEA